MDQPTPSRHASLPLAQASDAQLTQAVIVARGALSMYYPDLTAEQWLEALMEVGIPLRVIDNWATVTAAGLHGLIELLEHRHTNSLMAKFLEKGQCILKNDSPSLSQDTAKKIKKTYNMQHDVLETLERISFWQRVGKSQLVNKAVRQLLSDLPEAQIPIPKTNQ